MTEPVVSLADLLGPTRMNRLHDKATQMELDDVGLLRLIVEAWLAGHTAQPLQPVQAGLFANTTSAPPPTKKIRRSAQPGLLLAASEAERAEIDWRVERTWEAHRTAWDAFWRSETGLPTRAPREPNAEVRAAIVVSLRGHDGHLLAFEDREQWLLESETRAAGIGVFYDPWMTGHHKDNNVADGGKRYLGHDRPWVHQRNKPDPVSRFAALYFEQRSVFDEQDRRREDGRRPGAPVQNGKPAPNGNAFQRLLVQSPGGIVVEGGLALHEVQRARPAHPHEEAVLPRPGPPEQGGR